MKSMTVGLQLQADLKRLLREPILIILFLVPLLALTAIKLILYYGAPLLLRETGFDLGPYHGYVLSVVLLIAPSMLGAVSGFIMIDDRDERMTDLMSITPLGFGGYLRNRLLIPFAASMIYTLLGYFVLDIYVLDAVKLILLCLMTGLESMTVGLMLFILADNKVKGLTYAKGLSAFMFTALADLLQIPWLSTVSGLVPFFWISRLVVQPLSLLNTGGLLLIHILWFDFTFHKVQRR